MEDQLHPILTVCGCDDHTVCPCPRSCPQDEASFHLHSPHSHLSALSWRWGRSLTREDRTEFQHRCLVLGKRNRPHSPEALSFSLYCSVLHLSGAQSVTAAFWASHIAHSAVTHPDLLCPHDSQIPKLCFSWSEES